jgi:hypothetical protein
MTRKYIASSIIVTLIGLGVVLNACTKDAAPPPPTPNYSWNEGFDTLANAVAKGWVVSNNSHPIGISSWTQGTLVVADATKKTIVNQYPFLAQSSNWSGKDFTMASYNSATDNATISCWLISPETMMKNGDKINFYTRTVPKVVDSAFFDRLQVWLNPSNSSAEVGSTATSTGDFTVKLLDINETYTKDGYPREWAQYEITVAGLSNTKVKRRFAFRYFVENGGPGGTRSYGIGVDNVSFVSQ